MNETSFDAIVIGAGQGGTPLARVLAEHGWKTALVERRSVGGVCTNDGCTPTKTMVGIGRLAEHARRAGQFGVACGPVTVDVAKVKAHVEAVVRSNRHSLETTLAGLPALELIYGDARFAEQQPDGLEHAVAVRLRDGGERTLRSARVFLDVGERPLLPELDGLDTVPSMDSTTVLAMDSLPEHLLILGGGYIAVEFAQIFRRFGAAVTVVERGPQLVAKEDDEVAACLAEILREDGVEVLLGADAKRVRSTEEGIELAFELDGAARSVAGSHLLVATGRRPNTEELHCERVGVTVNERGYLPVDERLRTNVEGIWALGDVTGGPPYTHIAYDDFRVLRSQLLEDGSRVTTGRQVPYCIFTDPELGRVGLTERQAREAGMDVRVARAEMKRVARAREEGEPRGMMKAVVDRATGKLLGASILALGGGEMATELEIAMMGGLTAEDLREGIFTHPVLAEGLHVLFRNLSE